jgi:hypothetical protein
MRKFSKPVPGPDLLDHLRAFFISSDLKADSATDDAVNAVGLVSYIVDSLAAIKGW